MTQQLHLATAPGQRWNLPHGEDRWRLHPSTRTLTRLSDDASLADLLGGEDAQRVVEEFLLVRPGGGRVWVDDDGNAVTHLDGHVVYLGHLDVGPSPEVPDDGSLRSAVMRALWDAPDSSAREIVFALRRSGRTGATRTDVNPLLHGAGDVFQKDDSKVPRWRLVSPIDGDGAATAPNQRRPPASAATARPTVRDDAYADLLVRPGEPEVAAPVRRAALPPQPRPPQILELMAWQQEAVAAWYASGCHGIVEAVTGTGKTHVGLEAVAHAAAQGQRSTVLVPSVDLQDQWAARFSTFLPSLRVARVGGRSSGTPLTADATIAVVNSALKTDLSSLSSSSLLVADEVHRYGADEFQRALRSGYARRLGLTATLERSDEAVETVLTPYFGGTVLTVGFDRAIREKVVAPFRLVMAPVALTDEEQVEYDSLSRQISHGLKLLRSVGALGHGGGVGLVQQLGRLRGASGQVGSAARSAESGMRLRRQLLARLEGKLDAVEELAEIIGASEGSVLFTQSKEIAEEAAARLRAWGVAASALHSDLSAGERRTSLRDLEEKRLKALAAPKLLDEGIDLPTVDLGIVMTASRSRRQMVQRLGRVIRRKAGGRAVDFVILYAAATVEDPESGVHEGFFDLVGEVAANKVALETGWSAEDLRP